MMSAFIASTSFPIAPTIGMTELPYNAVDPVINAKHVLSCRSASGTHGGNLREGPEKTAPAESRSAARVTLSHPYFYKTGSNPRGTGTACNVKSGDGSAVDFQMTPAPTIRTAPTANAQ